MSKVRFSMNTGPGGGEDIIRSMAMPVVEQSAQAIASRATSIAGRISRKPPEFSVKTYVGEPNRRGGTRAAAAIIADDVYDEHEQYVGFTAVQKSKDAGRV